MQVKLLGLFYKTISAHMTRELAGLIGHSHNPNRLAPEELERNGLVIRRQAARSSLYSLDEDNMVSNKVLLR